MFAPVLGVSLSLLQQILGDGYPGNGNPGARHSSEQPSSRIRHPKLDQLRL